MQKSNFKIENSLYNSILINKAITDFDNLVKINYNNGNLIIFNDTDFSSEELFGEFMNYVIGLINE